ncbi:hypothetical protein HOT81_gp029 [Gordonia phage Fryberger]|uniref:Uncharacterized protein n=1 Tax=Gordonia phage Fryberger TaxID=2250392 RepID=A0A346FCI3_9CAUD|nr:hypothetical protein HOT81_gp029 [Gordonia phage Fryberger]AXN53447.1 hypothetical protein SEA_FRYBERGER_29 [Gordonia phage Fryberger]
MTKQPMPNDAELFDKVADILERDGWCQHEAHNEAGNHCALGALEVAAGEMYGDKYLNHYPRVYLKVTKGIDPDFHSVPAWNDTKGRTAQEVIDQYRALAKEETKRADGN